MKQLLLLLSLLTFSFLFANSGYEVSFEQNNDGMQLTFSIDDYRLEEVTIDGNTYTKIIFENNVNTTEKGFAELPFIHASVQLSDTQNITSQVISNGFEDITLRFPLLPSRGIIYRNQDPSEIPYVIAEESLTNEFYPQNILSSSEPFILRDIRGLNIYVHPFQYNAVDNTLRIHRSVTVNLVNNNEIPINPITNQSQKINREMNSIYKTIFINYDDSRFEHELADFGSILVIRTARDADAMAPYIEWKKQKGYTVYEEEVATGTNVQTLVSNSYNAHNDILYVQLVGDWADIQGPTSGGAPTDPNLGCVVGTDYYPDLIIGRFSANSSSAVTVQVNKTINYEQNSIAGADWYENATGIASSQGPGDDNELDYEHINVIYNNKLDPFTYNQLNPIYDPSANASMVANALNAGTGIINYCGHGSTTSWSSSGFNNTHVNLLTNGDMLPLIISVACVNGAFSSAECFAEAWLHKENGGAVGMYASTINQSWNPPMQGQDYINDLLTGGYDYTLYPGQNGINTDVRKTTFGALCFNGSILMTVEGPSGGQPMLETWHVFGDAALEVRTATTTELTLSNSVILMGVDFSTSVSSNSNPVEGAFISLYQDGISFTGITDENGDVSISHSLNVGDAKLTVTAFNAETIFDDVAVIPPGGAYLMYDDVVIDDSAGNNNGIVEHGEPISFTVGLMNVGTEEAENVSVTLSTTNSFVTLNNNSTNYDNIPSGSTVYGLDQFTMQIDSYCPDEEHLSLHLVITADADSWETDFVITSYAPILEIAGYQISDSSSNGCLEPGESATIDINLINNGLGIGENIVGLLQTDDPFITFDSNNSGISSLTNGETAYFDDAFSFSISNDCPAIHNIRFNLLLSEELGYYTVLQLDINVGYYDNVENGENGWTHSALNTGSDQWHQSDNRYFSEDHSWKAGSTTTGSYGSSLLCALESPEIELAEDVFLTFCHWMNAEVSASYTGECYDGGLVEVYYNNQWTQITPDGGYPYITRGDNTPPFPTATPVYSGEIDWERAFFDLSNYSGIVKFRFVFGSDGSANEEGWYIDDIAIVEGNLMLEPPADLFAENIAANEIELTWNAPSATPLSYNIYRRNDLSDPYIYIANSTEISYTDAALSGGTYYYVVTAVYDDGESMFSNTTQAYSGPTGNDEDNIVINTRLVGNYPNPFNPETTIKFSTTESAENTEICIYNIRGQKVVTLVNEKLLAGEHTILWKGEDEQNRKVASGIYFYKMENGDYEAVKKMLMLK